MAATLDQSCINCNISFLDNQTSCRDSNCPCEPAKQTKWNSWLFKKSSNKKTKNTYLNLNYLEDVDYPFTTTSEKISCSSDLTCSDWSLSTISSSKSSKQCHDCSIMTTDISIQFINKTKLRRFHSKISPL